jgi:hypothetical protein
LAFHTTMTADSEGRSDRGFVGTICGLVRLALIDTGEVIDSTSTAKKVGNSLCT